MNIVIDVETTGLLANVHEIAQVGALTFNDDLEPLESFSSYVRPLRPGLATPEALKTNGLTLEFLARQPLPSTVRSAFTAWLEDLSEGQALIPLGHNFHFDQGFLKSFLGLAKYDRLISYRMEDTNIAIRLLQRAGKLPKFGGGLQPAIDHFGIKRKEPHDALSDCHATLALYRKLINLLQPTL